MASTFLMWTLPAAVVAAPGDTSSLPTILTDSFGASPNGWSNFYLTYYTASYLQQSDFSYWNLGAESVTKWFVNGVDTGGETTDSFHNQKNVAAGSVSAAVLHAGNDIGPLAYVTVPINAGQTEYIQYSIITIDPHVVSPVMGLGEPTPQDIVDSAYRFFNYYGLVPNDNDCHFIAAAVAAATGATFTDNTQSLDPTQNEEGGFWRIAYRGSDPNRVSDWHTLVQPGDIVRMGWVGGGFHTTTILAVNPDGSMLVYDNVYDDGHGGTDIGIHTATYDQDTIASTITIYRLTTDGLYLEQGTSLGESLPGTVYNDHILGLGGNDTLYGAVGNDTIDGGAGKDVINGGPGLDTLIGGAGIDKFVFDADALTDAKAATPIADMVVDYDQGTSGAFATSEGDQVDVSAIVGTAFTGGQTAAALVRVVSDPSNAHVNVQVDADGTANGINWTSLTHLDGVHAGDPVNVILSGSQSAGTSFSVLSDDGHFGDFSGDGKADILWRDDSGTVATWQMDGSTATTGNFLTGVSSDWHIVGIDDFSGDAKSDVLWQNDNGSLLEWQMASAAQIGSTFGIGSTPANSFLAGTGDVDHDGKADLFWRDDTSGAVTVDTMAGASNTISTVGNDWSVVGVGDYNGDGVADVMFRNASQGVNAAWLMNGTSLSSTVFYSGVPNDWHVEGTGDFNGDGTSDLLWHDDNGANAVWLMNTSGNVQTAAFFNGVSSDWHVVGTGDFDGRTNNAHPIDDVIWRSDSGATAIWTMNGAAAPTVSFPGGVTNDWDTQAHHYDYV